MRLLILGGTGFAGRWLVDAALARGHEVSVFTRGSRLDRDVEHLIGDRRGDLSALAGRVFDAVIDTSAYVPSAVTRAIDALDGRIGHYTTMSSISAYAAFPAENVDERADVATVTDEELAIAEARDTHGIRANSRTYGETYGGLKALCEQAAEALMPGRTLHVRSGLIVGPGDSTRRFTYWVRRIARGGDVLVPGVPDRAVQFIDVRDLAQWMILAIERGLTGVYNAVGPESRLTMGELFDACRRVTGSDARAVWADDAFLIREGITPWTQLPLWLPRGGTVPWTETGWRLARSGADNLRGYLAASARKAIDVGLRFRPLHETIRDTLVANDDGSPLGERGIGLTDEKERELLARVPARLGFDEMRARVVAMLERAGLAGNDAAIVADNVVEAEARNLRSHGLILLPTYVRRILAGGIRARYDVKVVHDGGAVLLLDGGAGPGQCVAREAMQQAVARAKSFGIAWVTVRNTNHIGMLTSFAMQAVAEGLIGIVMSTTSLAAAPFGGAAKRLGTNPICIGVPTLDDPFLLDIATTTVSTGKVRLAGLHGEAIGADWIIDSEGRSTTDASVIDGGGGSLTTLGGYKGYGLNVAVDLLTGILAGSAASADVTSQIAHPDACVNATQTFLALDPQAFGGRETLRAAAGAHLAMLRNTPALREDTPVVVPGDLEAAALREARANGVALTPPILEALHEAERLVSIATQEVACSNASTTSN